MADCRQTDIGLAQARIAAAARTETGGKWLTVVVVLLLARHGGVQLPPRLVLAVRACTRGQIPEQDTNPHRFLGTV